MISHDYNQVITILVVDPLVSFVVVAFAFVADAVFALVLDKFVDVAVIIN